jgi:hypothetical protein
VGDKLVLSFYISVIQGYTLVLYLKYPRFLPFGMLIAVFCLALGDEGDIMKTLKIWEELISLSRLEVDLLCCYGEAIPEISDPGIRAALENFRLDHSEHLESFLDEISRISRDMSFCLNQELDEVLPGVVRGVGGKECLGVLLENERYIGRRYEFLLGYGMEAELRAQIEENYEDELDHIEYLEELVPDGSGFVIPG